jgi:hypothetical protein
LSKLIAYFSFPFHHSRNFYYVVNPPVLANNISSSANINSEIMTGFISQLPRQKGFILFLHALIISSINIKNKYGA